MSDMQHVRPWTKGTTHIDHDDTDDIRALLLGRRIVEVTDDHMLLDNGTTVLVAPNDGCGGCSSGGYWMVGDIASVDNIITTVELDQTSRETNHHGYKNTYSVYKVFVVAEDQRFNLFTIEGDDGNGYYGTGFTLHVREQKEQQ